MGDLSVKGIHRDSLGMTGDFLLTDRMLNGTSSLRAFLEDVARTERKYQRHDPNDPFPFRWKARYEQTWTHIRVRVKLKPKNKDAEDALDSGLRATWKAGIEGAWNGRYWARANGELPSRLSFEVVFTDDDPHHTVHVKSVDEDERSDMEHWNTLDTGSVAAHEFGHMIGKFDEYDEDDVPGREHVETGTVMGDTSSNFSPRQFTRFVQDLGCFLCFENGFIVPKPY